MFLNFLMLLKYLQFLKFLMNRLYLKLLKNQPNLMFHLYLMYR
jgi:hypothetical protein